MTIVSVRHCYLALCRTLYFLWPAVRWPLSLYGTVTCCISAYAELPRKWNSCCREHFTSCCFLPNVLHSEYSCIMYWSSALSIHCSERHFVITDCLQVNWSIALSVYVTSRSFEGGLIGVCDPSTHPTTFGNPLLQATQWTCCSGDFEYLWQNFHDTSVCHGTVHRLCRRLVPFITQTYS